MDKTMIKMQLNKNNNIKFCRFEFVVVNRKRVDRKSHLDCRVNHTLQDKKNKATYGLNLSAFLVVLAVFGSGTLGRKSQGRMTQKAE
jgi:hypothetical protein